MPEDSPAFNKMKSLQGHLLIAARDLADPNFYHTVVLIAQHSEEGALGLVLNRRSKVAVSQVWTQISGSACDVERPLYLGGPCPGPLIAMHGRPFLGDEEIVPGVFYGADKEHLEQLVNDDENQVKFFAGYAGWGAGQLEGEFDSGSWLMLPATADHVFGDEESLWETVVREIGRTQLISTLGLKHVPEDPSLN